MSQRFANSIAANPTAGRDRAGVREGWSRSVPRFSTGAFASVLLLLLTFSAQAQPDPELPPPAPDSTDLVPDDGVPPDSLPPDSADAPSADSVVDVRTSFAQFGPPIGSVATGEGVSGERIVGKEDLTGILYFSLDEALRLVHPGFPLQTSSAPGSRKTFSYAGASSDATAVLFNGRTVRGADGGAYDTESWSPEFVERVELVRGARALLFGADALLALNIVGPLFDVEGSYVRLGYTQGTNESTNADITYARNVGSATTLTLGFRRVSADAGVPNGFTSVWNGRGAIMWRPSDALTLSLTENFSDATRGVFGGLNEAGTAIFNDTLSERRLRHDVTLTGQWYPLGADSVALSSDDAANVMRVDGALYYTHAARDLLVGEREVNLPGAETGSYDGIGLRGGGSVPLGPLRLLANAEGEVRNGGAGCTSAAAILELPLADPLVLRAGGAATMGGERDAVSAVAELAARFSESLDLRFTARTFLKDELNALSSFSSLQTFDADRTDFLGEGEIRWSSGAAEFQLGGHVRRGLRGIGGDTAYTIGGVNLDATLPVWLLTFAPRIQATLAGEGDGRFPLLRGVGDLYIDRSLVRGNLDVRLGTSLEFQTPFQGARYDGAYDRFLYPSATTTEEQLYPLWNVYARGRIGSAYIRAMLYNILGSDYRTLDNYPVWHRSLLLQITWALVD